MDEKPDWIKAGEHDPAFGPPEYWGSTRNILKKFNASIAELNAENKRLEWLVEIYHEIASAAIGERQLKALLSAAKLRREIKAENKASLSELESYRAKVRALLEDADLFADCHIGDGDELGDAARRLKKAIAEVECDAS